VLKVVTEGLAFGESPRWHDGQLWCADWGTRQIIRVSASECDTVVTLGAGPFQPISIDWLPDSRQLIVASLERRVLCRDTDAVLTTYADLTAISDRGLNEIVVDGRGNAYVNGAGFDLMRGEPFKPGIIALVTPDGTARQVADGIAFPNGMVVTSDNSMLIVAESYGKKLTAFDIEGDGSLTGRRTWAALGAGVPDGICLDADSSVWYGDVPNNRCVRVTEGGEILQVVELDRGCFACMLGGATGRSLFMVAREWRGPESARDTVRTGQILTIEASASHAGWP
jgi:sugar lactone lactonase YvrE